MAAGLTASSASPGNVLATLTVAPPSGLTATAGAGGTVALSWTASPTAAQRAVEYAVLRRATGSGGFAEVARTSALSYGDTPPPGTYDYVVRAAVSSFTSADTAVATAATTP